MSKDSPPAPARTPNIPKSVARLWRCLPWDLGHCAEPAFRARLGPQSRTETRGRTAFSRWLCSP